MTSEEGQAWPEWKRGETLSHFTGATLHYDVNNAGGFIWCETEALRDQIIADHAAARDRESLAARIRELEAVVVTAHDALSYLVVGNFQHTDANSRLQVMTPEVWDIVRVAFSKLDALLSQGAAE